MVVEMDKPIREAIVLTSALRQSRGTVKNHSINAPQTKCFGGNFALL